MDRILYPYSQRNIQITGTCIRERTLIGGGGEQCYPKQRIRERSQWLLPICHMILYRPNLVQTYSNKLH